MSKGHLEAMTALKAMRAKSVTKPSVTKYAAPVGPMLPSEQRDGVGSIPASGSRSKGEATKPAVTKLPPVTEIASVPKTGRGRPKVHASAAERQRVCRARKKAHDQEAPAKG